MGDRAEAQGLLVGKTGEKLPSRLFSEQEKTRSLFTPVLLSDEGRM